MDSINRIYRACRARIAELAPVNYFISTGITLVSAALIFYSGGEVDNYEGVLGNGYFNLQPEPLIASITGIGWLTATIISGTIVNRYFKEENRGVRFLSQPLSNGERFVSLLMVNWLFVSIISFLPLIVLLFLLYFVRPDFVFMTWPGYYVYWMLLGPLMHLATLAFWLFPTVAYAKKAGYAVVGCIVAFGIYMANTRGFYADILKIPHTPTAYETSDVVGLSQYGFLEEQVTEVSFEVPDPQSFQLIFLAIVVGLMLFSAYLALTRKTA